MVHTSHCPRPARELTVPPGHFSWILFRFFFDPLRAGEWPAGVAGGPGGGGSAVYVPLLFGPEEFGEGGAANCVRCGQESRARKVDRGPGVGRTPE
jgi:hypothetical protein